MSWSDKKKVLLVEDDTQLRIVLEKYLQGSFRIDVASNGAEGLDLFINNHYDLVITDYDMPVMTGEEMIDEILKRENSFPIILITGNPPVNELGSKLTIITKPFSLSAFLEKIKKVLS